MEFATNFFKLITLSRALKCLISFCSELSVSDLTRCKLSLSDYVRRIFDCFDPQHLCVLAADNLEQVIQKFDYSVVMILDAGFGTKVGHKVVVPSQI